MLNALQCSSVHVLEYSINNTPTPQAKSAVLPGLAALAVRVGLGWRSRTQARDVQRGTPRERGDQSSQTIPLGLQLRELIFMPVRLGVGVVHQRQGDVPAQRHDRDEIGVVSNGHEEELEAVRRLPKPK